MDCSPPGSSVHGILQARILEWVAISFSFSSLTWEIPWTGYSPWCLKQLDMTEWEHPLGLSRKQGMKQVETSKGKLTPATEAMAWNTKPKFSSKAPQAPNLVASVKLPVSGTCFGWRLRRGNSSLLLHLLLIATLLAKPSIPLTAEELLGFKSTCQAPILLFLRAQRYMFKYPWEIKEV